MFDPHARTSVRSHARAGGHGGLGGLLLAPSLLASSLLAQAAPLPRTVAEQSDFARTSTHAEVLAFLAELDALPHAERLVTTTLGRSGEDRDLVLLIAAEPRCATAKEVWASGKLRVLINANIHGGEVEGKAAVQTLARELAAGEHADLLEHAVLLLVPDFNPDGNDRISERNRPEHNGPVEGVGERTNAAGLDLNRDFVKAESPEVRGLLGAFRRFDPHLFMDLHTTNGSYHGYHLTYAPSLSTNIDPALERFGRETILPEVRQVMLDEHGFRIFDYGNFPRSGPRSWSTYDHRPRFGTNYYGLRNRLALLSEAYSYLDFGQRVAVTRAFVLASVRAVVRRADELRGLCRAADAALQDSRGVAPPWFGFASELGLPVAEEVLVGAVRRDGERLVAEPTHEAERMPVQRSFRSTRALALPAAWALPAPGPAVLEVLQAHGISSVRLAADLAPVDVEVFVPRTAPQRAARPFQGHRTLAPLQGAWEPRRLPLPAGTVVVSARQPLARLAAQLLEAQSEDSLATWNVFDEELLPATGGATYPVLRLPRALESAPAENR